MVYFPNLSDLLAASQYLTQCSSARKRVGNHLCRPVLLLWQVLAQTFLLLAGGHSSHGESWTPVQKQGKTGTNWLVLSRVRMTFWYHKDDQCPVSDTQTSEACLLFLCLFCWGRGGYLKLDGRWKTYIIGLAVEAAESLQSGPSQWLPLPLFLRRVLPFLSLHWMQDKVGISVPLLLTVAWIESLSAV